MGKLALTDETLERYFIYKGYHEVPHDGLYRCFLDPVSKAKFWFHRGKVRIGPSIGEAVDFTEDTRTLIEAWIIVQEIVASRAKRPPVPQQFYDWVDVREGRRTMAALLNWPGAPEYKDHYLERTKEPESTQEHE